MASENITPATPEEFRVMLDEIGVFSRPILNGFAVLHWRAGVTKALNITQDETMGGWWAVRFPGPGRPALFYGPGPTEAMKVYLRKSFRI